MKIVRPGANVSLIRRIIVLLCLSLIIVPTYSVFAATPYVYEYDESGRLTIMYTATEKTVYEYDKNGNLSRSKVEAGDYSSIVNDATDPSLNPPVVNIPSEANLPTKYTVDQVKATVLSSNRSGIDIWGWYLDPAGLKRIDIYIDGEIAGRAMMGDKREDVYQAYPAYNNHMSGFHTGNIPIVSTGVPHQKQYANGTKEVIPGQIDHAVEIQMINRANQVTTYKTKVTIESTSSESDSTLNPPAAPLPSQPNLPTKYVIDQVKAIALSSNRNGVEIWGWYLDPDGIQRINIYIDGEFKGRATMGYGREDVYNVYPSYNNHVSGFHASEIPITGTGIPHMRKNEDGTTEVIPDQFDHTVEIQMISRAGQITTHTTKVTVEGKNAEMDAALNPPAAPVPSQTNLPTLYAIDQVKPIDISTNRDGVRVSGWYLNPVGIKRVDIYIDGELQGVARMGYGREDVYNVHPAYNNHLSGFYAESIPISTTGTPHQKQNKNGSKDVVPGQFDHTVEVRMINRVNQATSYKTTITIEVAPSESDKTLTPPPVPVPTQANLSTLYAIDQVKAVAISSNRSGVRASGWYLNPAGIKRIDIYIDGEFQGRASMGYGREDVYNVYPAYNNHVSGFYAEGVPIVTAGVPHVKQNANGTKEVVPGQFDHTVEIRMFNQADEATVYKSTVTSDQNQ